MTRDEINKLIFDNELFHGVLTGMGVVMDIEHLEKFVALVATAEREKCAKLCEEISSDGDTYGMAYSEECAAAIRARGRSEALTNLNKAAEDMGQEL